jgi:hypothetical protein
VSAVAWPRHRPTDDSAAAIQVALQGLHDERAAAERRLSEEREQRTTMLGVGTEQQVRAAESGIQSAKLAIERVDILIGELAPRLAEAVEREASEIRDEQVRDAATSIAAYNLWLAEHYETHVRAIAVGVDLEREAWRKLQVLRHSDVPTNGLPSISLTFVGDEGRALEQFARLPSLRPGRRGLIWP